ncbi:hypothetical protein Sjap_024819 [Stephania japonica]|uniref:Pentatricopeptide repeat-containing protein n=1 Tax=Stephania japonica TaxID=461633 RepID=A0AAP0EHB3_9MAGN
MPDRDTVSYNTFVSAYARRDRGVVECVQLFIRMQEECVKPNHITMSALIGASATLRDLYLVEVMHGLVIQCDWSTNEFVGSALVDAYAKRARLEDAVRAFEEISEADLVSWNVMINGCACNGSKELALSVFSRMRHEGLPLNSFTLASMTKICSEPSDLSRGMQLHGCIVKAGLQHETPVSNALITMYSKCEEGMMSAKYIFERTPWPNIISWTAMISGFMQNGQSDDAVRVYQRMLRAAVQENEFSFGSVLPAYSSFARLEQGIQVHARIIKSRFGLDMSVGNGLIDMYSKCGSLADAKRVFTTMERRDVVSWTTIITAFGQHGKAREALEILGTMTSEGFKPDAVTFLGVLSACSHGGLVDDGLRVFRLMIDDHGVKPHMRHYACVVDMLGRAGRLNEATKFIEDMGIQSDGLVWEALLSACRIHGEVELGARAAENLMQLKPSKDGAYVLLANIYADRGLWDDKGKVRERLDSSQLKKDTGHSWVAL